MRQNALAHVDSNALKPVGTARIIAGFLVKVGAPTVLGVGMFALELVTGALDVQALATLDVRHAQEDAECCAKMVVVLVVVERAVLGALQGALKAVAQDVTLCAKELALDVEAIVEEIVLIIVKDVLGAEVLVWGGAEKDAWGTADRFALDFVGDALPVRAIVFLHAKMYVGTAA